MKSQIGKENSLLKSTTVERPNSDHLSTKTILPLKAYTIYAVGSPENSVIKL